MHNKSESAEPIKTDDSYLTPDELLAYFEVKAIPYTLYHHEPFFSVEEAKEHEAKIPGTHCRNLFLRDKKKNNYLVVARNETKIDLKKLQDALGAARLSFGSPDRLWQYLKVKPGSVCPFAAINDRSHDVRIILEKGMMDEELVCYHPLLNTMTVSMAPANLRHFLTSIGRNDTQEIDFTSLAP